MGALQDEEVEVGEVTKERVLNFTALPLCSKSNKCLVGWWLQVDLVSDIARRRRTIRCFYCSHSHEWRRSGLFAFPFVRSAASLTLSAVASSSCIQYEMPATQDP